MSRRVDIRPRFGALLLAIVVVLGAPGRTDAQTTVVLDAPGSEAIDTMVQGGSSASINFDGHPLATRASGDLSYVRRALMKFDTETRIPAGSSITSARLTLTVKGGNSETRTLSAYRIVSSFDEATATWAKRKSGYYWSKGGGDFGAKYDDATVTATIGSKVTFDVTRLVQEAVNGAYGSRWTRIAVLDPGGSSRASY